MEMMENMRRCNVQAMNIYYALQIPEITGIYTSNAPDGHCFHLRLIIPNPAFPMFNGVSVSVPSDAYGNRGSRYGEPIIPRTIETALITGEGANWNLYHNDALGYDDVCRFDNVNLLIAELIRLAHTNGNGNDDDDNYVDVDNNAEYDNHNEDDDVGDANTDIVIVIDNV